MGDDAKKRDKAEGEAEESLMNAPRKTSPIDKDKVSSHHKNIQAPTSSSATLPRHPNYNIHDFQTSKILRLPKVEHTFANRVVRLDSLPAPVPHYSVHPQPCLGKVGCTTQECNPDRKTDDAQAYIDTSLVGAGTIDRAAIFSVNGKDNWAHSSDFKISPAEMTDIVKSFSDSNTAYANGIHVNGDKYTVIKSDADSLWTKKGKEGLIVTKTKQALILGHHPETVLTQQAVGTVEALGDYLKGVGY